MPEETVMLGPLGLRGQLSTLIVLFASAVFVSTLANAQSMDGPQLVSRKPVDILATADIPSSDSSIRPKPFRKDVNLVLVPVTVTDSGGHLVVDLSSRNFSLYEGGKPQTVQYFSTEDAPLSVGLILDFSASMGNKIEYERRAIEAFFNNANPLDEYFVVTVSDKPRLVTPFTQSLETILAELAPQAAKGETPLYDGVYMGVQQMRSAHYHRRALIVISDGGDNKSRYTRKEIKDVLSEGDVLAYAIGIFDAMEVPIFKTFEERWGRKWLGEITDASGGRTLAADVRRKIPEIAATISTELRNQYVLGFRPSEVSDGKWHKIKVKVQDSSQPQLHVYAKEGYLASAQ